MAQGSYIRQAAVIPFRQGRICLVTSSNGKRWLVPKGVIEPGQTAGETALQEAWEEAGLVGVLHPDPIGSYVYEKWCGACHVTVYRMDVTRLLVDWPERSFRERSLVTFAGALERIDDPGLADVVRLVVPSSIVKKPELKLVK